MTLLDDQSRPNPAFSVTLLIMTFEIANTRTKGIAITLLLVFACFTFSSSGYLAWLYHLIELAPEVNVDGLSMGGGYAFQGVGMILAAIVIRTRPEAMGRVMLVALVALHFACAAPAALSDNLVGTLAFGYVMNTLCGFISVFYLLCLASLVEEKRRGIVSGAGYACSIVVSWFISMLGQPIAGVPIELVACAVFSVIAVIVGTVTPLPITAWEDDASIGNISRPAESDTRRESQKRQPSRIITLACIAVLLMSMVKNLGFNFPSADIGSTVNLELSRLFYAVGLVVAGLVFDRSRKSGAILCMAALVLPFALMALSGATLPSMALWAIDYFFYGFFSVFRVVLFADLATQKTTSGNTLYLAGFGLMLGRFGDALGTSIGLSLDGSAVAMVAVAAVLFAASVFVFYQLFQQLYMPQPVREKSEREVFETFAARYELSPREREVLRLVIDDRTNAEAAAELFVSESTVKFHMRNLLKKTGCKNRVELMALYADVPPVHDK